MFFYLIVLTVSIFTAAIPLIMFFVPHVSRTAVKRSRPYLPAFAAVLFFISFFLPDVKISTETTTFQQHLVGGGMYSAILYYYFRQFMPFRYSKWYYDAAFLFAWVSSLGVANKLLEFALLKSHLFALDTTDAYWDLFANTLGAYSLYVIIYSLMKHEGLNKTN